MISRQPVGIAFVLSALLLSSVNLPVKQTLASPDIDYGNIDVPKGTDACTPDDVYEALKAQPVWIPPTDMTVRGLSARAPYLTEKKEKVGSHGMTRTGKDGKSIFHAGTDLLGEEGEAVFAVSEGTISKASFHDTLGNFVMLRMDVAVPPAKPCAVDFVYAHLQSISVKQGDKVAAGQELGKMGRTGKQLKDHSIPTHLHIELWVSDYKGKKFREKYTRDIMKLFNF